MKQISPSLTSKLRTDSVVERDYIIFSGETTRHYIWFKLYDDCYKDGNFIGTFVMKRLELTYSDSDLEFKQKEFNAYKEYKLDDGTWESIDYGTFIVQAVEESDTKEEIKVTAYDYALKFANQYVTELDYTSETVTLLQVLQECCNKCGVELATTDFANSGFLVDGNQFVESSMFGNVVSAVAGISCNFAKIKADNKLYLELKNETGIIIEASDYDEFDDKRDTHPYNAVSLGMSNVEGENVTIVAEGVDPEKAKFLTINDNPFAYTREKRNELIQAIFNKINGFSYSSFELKNCMYPQLECGDLVQVRNKEGQLVDTIVLRTSYEQTKINLEAPSTISATVTYKNPLTAFDVANQAQITVNQATKEITLIASQVEDVQENYTLLEQTTNDLTITVGENKQDVDNLKQEVSDNTTAIGTMQGTIKEMSFSFQTDGLKIGKVGEDINSTLDNAGLKIYNMSTLIAIFNKNGSGMKKVIATESIQLQNLLLKKGTKQTQRHGNINVIQGFWQDNLIETLEDLEVDTSGTNR